ncbi:MAG TPA: sialidase family protein [Actinomycetota bacterium]|nr:sialidase family protein [Actinomycetota bacterium]
MTFRNLVATTALVALASTALLFPAAPFAGAAARKGDGSGGRTVAHHAQGKRISAPAIKKKAPEADLYPTGHDAVEPSLGQTKNGMVFYTAAGTRNEVVRSKDGGKSWEVVSPALGGQNVHAISLDPYLYVDEWTNRVYTIDLLVGCSLMSYSDDHGQSWTTNPLACGRPVNDHQTLFSGPPVSSPTVGYDNVVYYCWNDVATSACGKSIDGGLTWRATGEPAFSVSDVDGTNGQNGTRHCGGLHGHGVVGHDGTVFLPKEHCTEPWLAISKDEGTTWERVKVSNKVAIWGPDPSVAVDAKGNIYYLFLSKDRLPYLSYSRNGGKTWSEPLMVGTPGLTETALATLDAGAPGKVAIAYYGTDDVSGKIAKREYPAEVMWNGYMTMTDNLFTKKPVFYSGAINTAKDPLARGACGPRRCFEAYDFIDVVVGFDGSPWASFSDSCVTVCAGTPAIEGTSGVVGRLINGPKLR